MAWWVRHSLTTLSECWSEHRERLMGHGSSDRSEGIGEWVGAQTPQDITAKTTAEMKTANMVVLIKAEQAPMLWSIDPDINDG